MMKKYFMLLLASLLVSVSPIVAQERIIRAFEGEIALGTTFPTYNLGYDGKLLGINYLVELRYNQRSLPLDYGLMFRASDYRFRDHSENESIRNTAIYWMAVSDYNFRRNENASFFVGAGVGFGNRSFCVMPRCGVELWRHMRMSLSYYISAEHLSGLSVTVGVVFGGGKKKAK